jgi:hypothetical protein
MEDAIMAPVMQMGFAGFAGVLLVFLWKGFRKMVTVVENNTEVMTEVKIGNQHHDVGAKDRAADHKDLLVQIAKSTAHCAMTKET